MPAPTTSRLVIWLLCGGALALACGPHAHHNESAASTTDARPTPAPALRAADDAPALTTSTNVDVTNGVSFALRITNRSDHAVELNFSNGQTHDFIVVDSLGREIWRWSNGRLFTQTFQNKLLGARESVTYEEHWAGRGRQGHYTAVALLKSINHPVEERVAFTLP